MTRKATAKKSATSSEGTNSPDALVHSLKAFVRSEVQACLGEANSSSSGKSGGSGKGGVDVKKLTADLLASAELTNHINNCLEQGLRNVIPQLIQRLKTEAGSGGEGGSAGPRDIQSVVNSVEMKEMLEDQFRTMLLYLKQDVIPKELAKQGQS